MKIDSTVLDATIINVGTRQVGARNSTLWEIETQEGTKWVTFKADLGNTAQQAVGATVDMDVSIEQKDTFTNYYVNQIRVKSPAPAGATNQAPPTSDIAQLIQRAQGAAEQKQEMSFAEFGKHEQEKEARKNLSIHRQSAAKTAAALGAETSNEFWSNVKDLFSYFQTGQTPFEMNATDVAAPQAQKTANYGLPTHAGTPDRYTHTDADAPAPEDDIPF